MDPDEPGVRQVGVSTEHAEDASPPGQANQRHLKGAAMALSMDDIVRRLTSGEDLESVARSLLPDKERELLRRLAVVRAFDQRVFETVLRPGIDGEGVPAFANLAAQDYIEAIPGAEPRYRLRAGWRSEYFRSWWPQSGIPAVNPTVPEALQKFSRQLADYYANRKRHEGGRQLEVLFHLVLVDQVRALKLFKDLYESEDKQFNLAGC